MNIFIFDLDPNKCAKSHGDRHVVKMCTEYCQMLSTAARLQANSTSNILYKATHKNHPCTVWVMQSRQNYEYLLNLAIELFDEYTHRYGKVHASSRVIPELIDNIDKIPLGKNELTPFVGVLPGRIVYSNVINEYRSLYLNEKSQIAKWKNRNPPEWYIKAKKDL